MAALRRQAPHPGWDPGTFSAIPSIPSDHAAPIFQSEASSSRRTPTIDESILDTLQAATAPYRLDDPQVDSGLQLDLDTIMANIGLANRLDKPIPVAAPSPDSSPSDVTFPQLPPSIYGVELLPKEPATDEEADAPILFSPRSEYSGEHIN